ncbi:Glyoxylase, beta-lactamase superfamily II [Raineyella antarctica]|uniref:Glyoxylase, beta-lactamase superfamily II n=1 Tax=Raineyella antarctica TaxID=1577474 RepID=A0A1G6GL38_9ACTN|nr:rhodanese-like domain-containing protein [Raineyella antarctica]SDB82563.1 Glyoxylase, beta-lactamase superfamily II [Raineyella antarctica]
MHFTQYYLDCLSHASYLVGDPTTGRAVVVDPRRDVEEYLADAKAAGLAIEGVILTHFHADFVSGHLELARATGAWIGYGEVARPDFDFRPLADGERISLGELELEIMSTPGHTPESISVLVYEHATDEVPYGVLTGDALFIGDVGRPDLLASIGVSQEELVTKLYDSVQHKLMGLPDQVRVFPAHGAGSACGKNLSTERSSTIGQQRLFNYACRPMSEQEFAALVTDDQPSAPAYFVHDAIVNRSQRPVRDLGAEIRPLDAEELAAVIASGAAVLDSRDPMDFAAGHLAGSVNVGFGGRMAETAGMVIDHEREFVVVADPGQEQATALRMARIGFDRCVGYLPDVETYLVEHPQSAEQSSRLTAIQMFEAIKDPEVQLVDIRNVGELVNGTVDGARHIPLAELPKRYRELDPQRPVLLHCAGGYRSSVGASWLRQRGYEDVSDVLGGWGAIETATANA